MTTTLSEGVKVPDVGSVNWAGDLEVNWNLLNGALANLSGNVKLDRDNTWTGEQSFTLPIVGSITGTAAKAIADEDGTSIKTGYVNVAGNQTVTGQKTFSSTITTKTNVDRTVAPASDTTYGTIICRDKNGSAMFRLQGTIKTDLSNVWDMMMVAPNASYITFFKYTISGSSSDRELRFKATSVIPDDNSTADLGISTNQWKSVYSQTYYYNGTAWGLDKANEWSGENTFSAANLFRKRAFTLGDNSSQIVRMEYKDTNNSRWGILSFIQDTNNTVHCDIGVHALKTDGQTVLNKSVTLLVKPDNSSEFKPINDKAIDLGTSTNKWKTFNGINPGALSFPRIVSAESRELDRTNWDYTGTNWNTLDTSAMTGWGYIYIADCSATDFILIRRGATNAERPTQSANPILDNNGKYYLYITFPIVQNTNVYALIRTSGTVTTAVVYPCQGNV